jgi:hypothetical protein
MMNIHEVPAAEAFDVAAEVGTSATPALSLWSWLAQTKLILALSGFRRHT